tara:strand:- start:9776 stop:10123 length:348 start_codon:yes stop_codon:yes gene_type:complete
MAKKITKPSFKPTAAEREYVEQMSSIGLPQSNMARVIRGGIDEKTLRKYFREELDTAATKASVSIGGALFQKAMAGDTTAMIWWSKTRMGWKETSVQEHAGKDGGPIVLWGKQPK